MVGHAGFKRGIREILVSCESPPQETPVVLHRLLLFNYWSLVKGSILISDGVYRAIGHV